MFFCIKGNKTQIYSAKVWKNNEINNLLKYFQEKDQKIIFDSLLKLLSYNYNILAPIESDVRDIEIIDFKKFFITII